MINSSPILITGGTGLLGKTVCQILDSKGITYQIASHQQLRPDNSVFMDLRTGEGMQNAVRDKSVILHLASDKKHPDNDVYGTAHLLNSLKKQALCPHFIYISIVGVEELAMPYFKQKVQIEQMVIKSGLPYSIVKATQFHEYIDSQLTSFFRFGIGLLPKNILVQPVSVVSVANVLADLCMSGATYEIQSLGGPEVLKLEELASQWLQHRKESKKYLPLPLWGKSGKKLKDGVLTYPQKKLKGVNWSSWLKEHYPKKQVAEATF